MTAWARYQGGALALEAAAAGQKLGFELVGTRAVTGPDGAACTEGTYVWKGEFPGGELSFCWTLTPEAGDRVVFWDYGVAVR